MTFDPAQHHRRSIRLKGYDYSLPGLYFITVCTLRRECLLASIRNSHVFLTDIGKIVQSTWCELPRRFGGLELNAFVIMPNHIHGIVAMSGRGLERRVQRRLGKGGASPAPTILRYRLPDVVRAFKSLTTLEMKKTLRIHGPLWQRGYFEHIIRNVKDLEDIREYTRMNPVRWKEDPEYPERKQM